MFFVCPKCKLPLVQNGNSYICKSRHCFDIAKSGYVNLLMNNRSSSRGDDKEMVKSRKDFLDSGYYDKLINRLCDIAKINSQKHGVILDAGCGEGKYTEKIFDATRENECDIFGIDISKIAVDYAKKRCKNINFAVAGINDIPLSDESTDLIFNIFAPEFDDEFLRIIKKNGLLIKVIPLEYHLIELKNILYENVTKNDVKHSEIKGFSIESTEQIKYKFGLSDNKNIINLFTMTPYYYKTSQKDREKLEGIDSLELSAEFEIIIYRKK